MPFVRSSPLCALDAVDVTFLLPSLLPIGGAKGYGLALMIGLFAGTLNGAAIVTAFMAMA